MMVRTIQWLKWSWQLSICYGVCKHPYWQKKCE